MDNTLALQHGNRYAKELIARHILNKILVPMAKCLIEYATKHRINLEHNMTGNTVNSYAVGIYVNGRLVYIQTSSQGIPNPLRRKLNKGQKYLPNTQRWDGELQANPFTAEVSTNGSTEPDRCMAFLQSYQPSPNGWTLVMCNGVEYAVYQESVLGVDVMTDSYNEAQFSHLTFFQPMPE